MKVVRRAEIERSPSELLDAVARVHEEFIISPTVLSDEGRIFRVVITGGGTAPHTETIRVAPAGAGRSAVDVTVEDSSYYGMLDRIFSRGSLRRALEATADTLIARLQRGDLRPDAVESASAEDLLRETKQKIAEAAAASPSFARAMAEGESSADRALAKDPPKTTIEILTLDGVTRYKNAVVMRIPARE